MTTTTQLTVEERLTRLEDVAFNLSCFVSENRRDRFTRSIAANDAGNKILAFVDAVAAERAEAQKPKQPIARKRGAA